MPLIIGSRRDADGNSNSFFDTLSQETTARFQPAVLDEDFVGAGHSSIPLNGSPATGYPWVQRTQKTAGTPTVAVVANSPGGVAQLALDATSEKQEATLYANDQLNWDVTKGLVWETRAALSVVPSAAAVESVFGLQSAWIDGPDNAGFYVRFQVLGNGNVNIQSKDGVNTFSIASGVTLVAGAFHIFRIDASSVTDVQFFIDGARVSLPNAVSFAATGASAVMQPYCSVYKASGVGVGSLQVDAVQAGMNRS